MKLGEDTSSALDLNAVLPRVFLDLTADLAQWFLLVLNQDLQFLGIRMRIREGHIGQ